MKFLAAHAPSLPLSDVESLLSREFGLAGPFKPLHAERDQNLLARDGSGAGFVVKIFNAAEDPGQVNCQISALRHVAAVDPTLPVPHPRLTRSGEAITRIAAPDGRLHLLCVLSFLEGRVAGPEPLPARVLTRVGALQARLARAMRGFFHPAVAARELLWDVRLTPRLRPHVALLPEADRAVVHRSLDEFETRCLPGLPALRAQIQHADLHGHNLILAADGAPTAIIDFGDMIHGPLVQELAGAMADFSTAANLVQASTSLLRGYSGITGLEDAEIAQLYDLMLMRVIGAALILAYRRQETPEDADYLADGGFGSLDPMKTLLDLGRDRATDLFRDACGARPLARTSPSIDALLARRRRVMGSKPYIFYDPPLHIAHGSGVWLHDAGGRRYLDFYNNVPIVGHCHPAVADAIARQSRILNTNTRYLGEEVLDYAERLGALTGGELTACVFVNSGSEANDVAWRMAQAWTGARGFLCQDFAYHGITEAIAAVSPSAFRNGTPAAHVRTLLAPDRYRGPHRTGDDLGGLYAADADRAIASLAKDGMAPAAVIVDSAFMTNGVLEPMPGYVAGVFARVRAAGGLCIADEVQSGFGRMGETFWGYQHHGVVPDLLTIGKPAGNGHPIGVVLTRPEILDHFVETTEFFSTFGGNNVSCAAGLAVLDVIRREDLVRQAAEKGLHFKAGLRALLQRYPVIGDVRVTGLAAGLELVADRGARTPAPDRTTALVNFLRDEGVLVGKEGIHGNVVKMRPPLVVTLPEIDIALAALERALARL